MAKIWRNRILAGDQKFNDCPAYLKDAVLDLLNQDLENGVITEEEYKKIVGEN